MANAEVKITDEDIQAYITENKEYLPANTNTAEVKESIRKQLENTAQTEAFEKWFTELQKRSNVVIRSKSVYSNRAIGCCHFNRHTFYCRTISC